MTFDLAIIGGGPAGMSAALVAGRARVRALVINDENPRNLKATASHGFLTRDGTHARELLEIAKDQLRRYPTVSYRKGLVKAAQARAEGAGYSLRLSDATTLDAKRVILAAGCRDDLASLRLPGAEQVYGKSLFPCPFCDAYEHADERLAIFGAEGVEQHAALVRMWSADVHVFTNGRALKASAKDELMRNGVTVHEAPVIRLHANEGRLAAIEIEGATIERDVAFLWDRPEVPATSLPDELGVRRKVDHRGIVVYEADDFGKTNVPGIYVVGDLRNGFSKLMTAASEGSRCAERIVHDIARERWR